ncbi:MAG: hypothetical protein SAJ37_22495 [Oscillatoria sp. PMC 1068.18]|nr:hypothetical protein [Oscillatoria sp. PMC 1076.18]MEC4991515.1 hypothetical protein [Oscillatoria sp. PMC 1068.18]
MTDTETRNDLPLELEADPCESPNTETITAEAVSSSEIVKISGSEPLLTDVESATEAEITIEENTARDHLDKFPLTIDSLNTDASSNRDADWFAVARKLRQRNRELLKKVSELEQNLAASHEEVQSLSMRNQSAEKAIAKQAAESQTNQEQLARFFRELESAHQVSQRQQILIETLSEQLETSSDRISQLETEYSLLKQAYDDQARHLSQTEAQSDELTARLQRQQRQTLQYKAALDKCLEVTPETINADSEPENQLNEVSPRNVVAFTKAQPIQPWSAQLEDLAVPPETTPNWTHKTDLSETETSSATDEQNDFSDWFDDLTAEIDSETPETPEKKATNLNYAANYEKLGQKPNSPSPIVYPLRSGKKRESLAAIDLPSFPRRR